MTAANATIQTTTEPAMRGRVMSLYMMVFLGVAPIGSPIVGWVGEAFGARWSIGVGAIASLAAAGGAALVPRRWNVQVSYHVRRPMVRVTYSKGAAADQAARDDATQRIREQAIVDAAGQP